MKKTGTILTVIGIIIVFCASIGFFYSNQEIKTIKNEKDLLKAYENNSYREMTLFEQIITLPFSTMIMPYGYRGAITNQWDDIQTADGAKSSETNSAIEDNTKGGSTKDFSKTNIQVEGVDEADIIKTDGNYIYSLSESTII